MENQDQYMEDAQGRLVPSSMVSEIDKCRNALVIELVDAAKRMRTELSGFKARSMGDVAAFVDLSAERYGVKLGGRKGNISLVSYDGKRKIQVAISEHLIFDERLQAAKKLIDECITEWAENSRDEIKALINDAFQVDKEGRINTNRVLGLRRLDIRDPKWLLAMQAITDSLQVIGSKTYFRIYERTGPDEKWEAIPLDLAAL
ncbi:MAG: DUF3164 family protein [Pseudomonadota bacterium]